MLNSRIPRSWFVISLLLSAFSFSGCAGLQFDSLSNPFDLSSSSVEPSKSTVATAPPGQSSCVVDFRSKSKTPQLVQLPVSEGMCIQDAIRESRALKKYRRITIDLYRQLPKGGWHKMDVPFDNAKDQVRSGYDYAIHGGDRLIITEDTSTAFDRMLESMTGSITKR